MNSTAQDEIVVYVSAVRSALTGLPPETREELLEDLPEHLAEVLSEGTGTLVERLGSPEAYAAELLATAGFVGGFPDPPKSGRTDLLLERRDQALALLRRLDARMGPALGHAKASDFLRLLRPAWWVLRGYLAAMVIAGILDGSGQPLGLLPRVGGSLIAAMLLLAGCVTASVWLARQDVGARKWGRYALYSGTTLLVVVALTGFLSADGLARSNYYEDAGYYDPNPYSNVQDVFVYDHQGNLVPGARLFDQDGSPIQLGNAWCQDETTGASEHSRSMGYPYCPENQPFRAPSLDPSAGADPSRSAAPSAPAAPSGRPGPAASVTPSVRPS